MIADLVNTGTAAADTGFRPLGGGRTNDVWAFRSAKGAELVLKTYATGANNPLFRNDPASERLCLKWLDGTGLAPRPVATGTSGGLAWLIYRHIEGRTWRRGSARVAQLLRRVHELPPPTGLPVQAGGSRQLSRQAEKILSRCPPSSRRRLKGPGPVAHVDPAPKLCLVHGDPVPGNIVVSNRRIVLIDWQCPMLGDPAEDLAIFLSPAMQFLYRGSPLARAERQVFLHAYPDRATVARFLVLEPWFHWRMAAYCLWQAGRGRSEYARAFELERKALAAQAPADRESLPTET